MLEILVPHTLAVKIAKVGLPSIAS